MPFPQLFSWVSNCLIILQNWVFVCFQKYVENLLKSDGILSSVQFAFTALLTLLIPLLIFLFQEKTLLRKDEPEFEKLDNFIISKVANIKELLVLIIPGSFFILIYNKENNPYWNLFLLIVILVIYILLVLKILKLAEIYSNINKARLNTLKETKNRFEAKKEWFEQFCKKSNFENSKEFRQDFLETFLGIFSA